MPLRTSSRARLHPPARTGIMLLSLVAMAMSGCVAAIPIIMYEVSQNDGQAAGYAVTAQMDVAADKVYQTCVDLIKRSPKAKILSQDDAQRSVKFEFEADDGLHHDSFRVTSISARRSQMVAIARTPSGKQVDQSRAVAMVRRVCEELGVKYNVIKG